jgi:hypothetical protein
MFRFNCYQHETFTYIDESSLLDPLASVYNCFYMYVMVVSSVVVKALSYKPEGRQFETRWGEWFLPIYIILYGWRDMCEVTVPYSSLRVKRHIGGLRHLLLLGRGISQTRNQDEQGSKQSFRGCQNVPPKRLFTYWLYGAISQKMITLKWVRDWKQPKSNIWTTSINLDRFQADFILLLKCQFTIYLTV